ncbi:MAG: branched-chain amino acid ABC transporter permease [Firmicutes bacterium]|nr:branched-chain amino acid ABC transporter permease [Bacillota bacterium]
MGAESLGKGIRGGAQRWTVSRTAGILVILALALYPVLSKEIFHLTILNEVLVFAIFAMSLDLLLGYTGLVSFGHAAYFAAGGYAAGLVAKHLSQNFLVTLTAGVLAAVFFAFLIGLFAVRTSGINFIMVTLAFAQMVYAYVYRARNLTGGSDGLSGIPRPYLGVPGIPLTDKVQFYYLTLVFFIICYLLLSWLVRSPLGRSFVGIRENEARMRSLGYNVRQLKLISFIIGAGFAGVGGVLFTHFNNFIGPEQTFWGTSAMVMIMVILGGTGTLAGPALGAAVFLVVRNVLSYYTTHWHLIMGLLFIAFVMFAPQGIFGLGRSLGRLSGELGGRKETPPKPASGGA